MLTYRPHIPLIAAVLFSLACGDTSGPNESADFDATAQSDAGTAAAPDAAPRDTGEVTMPGCACEADVETGRLSAECGAGACVGAVGYRCNADGTYKLDQRFCPLCSNECIHANDGECDDGGPDSLSSGCVLGTDCGDCGERWQGAPGEKRCEGPRTIDTNDGLQSLEGCTHLSHWLKITGGVSDLSPLRDLREIEEELNVDGTTSLTVLDLPNLESLGHLQLWYTQGLREVRLPKLANITRQKSSCTVLCGGVRLSGNASLVAFDLPLVYVAQMQIDDNWSLASLGPFENMTSVTLWLSNNHALSSLGGFPSLARSGTIEIRGNDGLLEIAGFDRLEQVSEDLLITANDRLGAIHGFSSLRQVGNELRITSNPSLSVVDAFSSLKRVGRFHCGGDALEPGVCEAIEARLVD